MNSKFSKYVTDLTKLIERGELLQASMERDCLPDSFAKAWEGTPKEQMDEVLKALPVFSSDYQAWYSEAKALIRQLLPDRLSDFVRHYEKPKSRKEIDYENYRIEDYLQALTITSSNGFGEKKTVVGPSAAIPQFRQQLAILNAVKGRFESSLFDIKQLVQADVFDSELESASELAKKGFSRAAGAICGVVLERHLGDVARSRTIMVSKRHPTIAVYNDALKDPAVIDTTTWRYIQYLGDIRNQCDHAGTEPTNEQVTGLIDGVTKIIKTVF